MSEDEGQQGGQARPGGSGVRLSMDLAPDTHYDLKQEALVRGISMTELVTRLIEVELYGEPTERRRR